MVATRSSETEGMSTVRDDNGITSRRRRIARVHYTRPQHYVAACKVCLVRRSYIGCIRWGGQGGGSCAMRGTRDMRKSKRERKREKE